MIIIEIDDGIVFNGTGGYEKLLGPRLLERVHLFALLTQCVLTTQTTTFESLV